jgi:predicted nucleic acid-binding protein
MLRLEADFQCYGLTDCPAMNVMCERRITKALTYNHHFTQEGFTILL